MSIVLSIPHCQTSPTCLLASLTHRDDDVAGPEPALVGGAVRVDLAQHQVQTVLIAANMRLSIILPKFKQIGDCWRIIGVTAIMWRH